VNFVNDKTFELIEKLYSEFSGFRDEVNQINAKISTLDKKTDKNTMLLERVNDKIQILAEVQQNHLEINERQHDEMSSANKEQIELLKNALHHVINT
jgi:dsDNA-specific endonuclease/ATPase MutS2